MEFDKKNINLYCTDFKSKNNLYMLIVQVKDGESIDKAIKKYKRKYDRTGVMRKLRSNQQFVKSSVITRQKKIRSVHKQRMISNEEN